MEIILHTFGRILKSPIFRFSLVVFTIAVQAREVQASEILSRKVTIQAEKLQLKEVLYAIEKQVHVQFTYSQELVNTDQVVSINSKNAELRIIFEQLFSPLSIKYSVFNENIVVLTKAIDLLTSVVNAGPVKGKVSDANGNPLPGATVQLKGTTNGVTTDVNGEFTINCEQGSVLIVSYIGFSTEEITVAGDNLTIILQESLNTLNDIVIVGSHFEKPRTDVERPVPVDVISAKELETTGQIDLGQMAQFTSPSFNSSKNAINGVANYADPASLRGMSPDQSLVLINGKRRHQFSAINANITVGKGTVVTDLNSIPSMAIERLEILRDGAAAQYGSDAIAGIMNLSLKKNVNSGSFKTQFGITSRGDGGTAGASLNYGIGLGKQASYLNFTLHYQYSGATDRSDEFTGNIYDTDKAKDNIARDNRGVWPTDRAIRVSRYGNNQSEVYQAFINMSYPLSKGWSLYSFGGISMKDIVAAGFFRNAIPRDANSSPEVYPDGYTPELPGKTGDYSLFTGVTKKSANGWNIDISTGYGLNYLDLFVKKSINPSLGTASPRDFYVGRNTFGQSTSELSFSKDFGRSMNLKSFNLALGGQFRVDNYQLKEGDLESYQAGPLAPPTAATPDGKAVGSSGRPGIAPEDRVNKSRSNIGLFADLESDITDKFLIAIAGRYENYSDFGGNLSGKFATRYKFTESFSIRGSINRGFRAPSLQQIYNGVTSTAVQAGVIAETKQLRSDDERLSQLGIKSPKAELSWNYNIGLTAKAGDDLLFTVDAYQIDVEDRIIISEQLAVSSAIPALLTAFPTSSNVKQVTFFTNQIDTRTQGIDFVTSYNHSFSPKKSINASLAFTFNSTNIVSQKDVPEQLQAGAPKKIILIDTVSISLIESSQPRNKVLASIGGQFGKFSLSLKATYFGSVKAWEKPRGLPHRSQTFSGKAITDATLVYSLFEKFSITLGANNLFDVFPDKVFSNYGSYFNGQVPYTRNAGQFGFNGAYYYTTLTLKL
jgi:iron complex outermembrane recepter protein